MTGMTVFERVSRSAAHKSVWQFPAVIVLGAVIAVFVSVSASSSARAESLPFWEQRDIDDAKAARHRTSAMARLGGSKKYAGTNRKKLGGHASATEAKQPRRKGVRVAALGNTYYPTEPAPKSLSGGGVRWAASSGCLDAGLKAIVQQVSASYGPVTVNSTCRSKGHNRAVGGAPRSKHLSGDAVDFRVHGNVRAVYAFLRSNGGVGGLKHYGGGLFHIDTGPRRSW